MVVIMSAKKRLIVFLVPPQKIVNGGILSIFSICKVSRQFKNIHKSDVMLSVYPGHKSYKKNDLFDNDEVIHDFDEVVKMGRLESLLVHVPEYASYDVCQELKQNYSEYLQSIPDFRVNIMHQNILLMQPPLEVANWFELTPNLTQTTAHNRYSDQALADKYAIPVHHLSTFVDQNQYKWTPYEKKEKLITISLDDAELKEKVLAKIGHELPNYKVLIIKNMRYEDYKTTISRAKFTITFGEGFDGYYVEGFFTGGIAFAVYNDEFFPDKDFAGFKNTYSNYEEMLVKIVDDMRALDSKPAYENVVQQNLDKINRLYNFENYQNNVGDFYKGKYTYLPSTDSIRRLAGLLVKDRDLQLAEKDATIKDLQQTIAEKDATITAKDKEVAGLLGSKSWKVTKPLRQASAIVKKREVKE